MKVPPPSEEWLSRYSLVRFFPRCFNLKVVYFQLCFVILQQSKFRENYSETS